MSVHQFFKRQPVDQQVAQRLESTTFPAPTRGLVLSENESFMQPGAAIVMDNWVPTMKGAKLRGGCEEWCDLHAGSVGDVNFADVKLLLGVEGADASTTVTDESPALKGNATITGNSQVDTAQFKFGASSLLLDGTGDKISFPDSVDWELSGQFTIEAFIRINSFATATTSTIVGHGATSINYGWWFTYSNAGLLRFRFDDNGDGTALHDLQHTTPAMTTGVWYHVAVDRDAAGVMRLYIDGVMRASKNPATGTSFNAAATLDIGYLGTSTTFTTNGWIDELRITKGTARYASDSGYTAPTAAFPRSAGIPALPPGDPARQPVISAFEYASGINHRMFAANETNLYDVTTTTPVLVKSGQLSGNYVASQMANASGDYLMVVNDAGDPLLRYNGSTWTSLATTTPAAWVNSHAYAVNDKASDTDYTRWKCLVAHSSPAGPTTFAAHRAANPTYWTVDLAPDGLTWITGPPGMPVENGAALTYVCKYRNRYFFVERNSMNAWYLPLNSVGGALAMIPLSGAATKGGKLLFCAAWSIDAGDGIDDKLVFCTDLGELLIFTGSDPASAASWRQEGRYEVSPPMGMNAHLAIGGDMLIATVDGIVPISGSITKDRSELELAAITRQIKPMWRDMVLERREWAWTMCKWDEYGGLFVTWPGGIPGKRWCAAANLATGAWCRFVGYDATCFIKMRGDMFFGTQDGRIMQADRTGYDDGVPYTATLVGGWEVFQSPGQTITWRQARASFSARANEPFAPQLSATTDYVVTLPTPPNAGPDPGALDLWDEGLWGTALWDAAMPATPAVRNTGWVSIGRTGFSHAPVVQVTVAQVAKPVVDLISIAATFERAGINV